MVLSEYPEGMRMRKGGVRFTYRDEGMIMGRTEKSFGGKNEMRF